MPLSTSPWHTLAPLATPLAGTEKLLADDGTANGTTTVAALKAAAQVGVTLNSDAIAQTRVTNLVTDLSAKASRAELNEALGGIATDLSGKANVGDMPANLSLSTLRLDKRSSPPAAPGSGKCILWIGQTPGGGNGDKWTLFATTGETGATTPIFAEIYAPVWVGDPFWSGPLLPVGGSGSDGDGYEWSDVASALLGGTFSAADWRITTSFDFPVRATFIFQFQDASPSSYGPFDFTSAEPLDFHLGTPSNGRVAILFESSFTAPTPAPTISILKLIPG